jgi:hypothetical protein
VIVGLGSAALALWLFLAPFRFQVFKDPELEVGMIIEPSMLRGDLAADCGAPVRQLVAPPTESPGVPFVSVANLQPVCRSAGRDRALASLGFGGAALLAFLLAAKSTRVVPVPRQTG